MPVHRASWQDVHIGGSYVSVEEKVVGIVSDQLDSPKEDISRASSFVDDLKADSLDIVELVMALVMLHGQI